MAAMVVRGRRVLLGTGVGPASIHVKDGRIDDVAAFEAVPPGAEVVEAGELLVTPGVVDSHVHINEPGRTEWEGFRTATEAAAAGGITTVVDMPLNCIPATTSRAAAEAKLHSLRDQLSVDVAFWGGVIPGNTGELAGLADFGAPGAKCFLCPSGVDEFPCVTRADLEQAMPVLRDLGLTLLVHAEVPGPLEAAEAQLARESADPKAYSTYLRSRPKAAEDEAIAMVIDPRGSTAARAHRSPVERTGHLDARAQADGCRSRPRRLHYLTFEAEETGGSDGGAADPGARESNARGTG
ncbi:MAG: amidohydrolase family protein [Polyangiaceae bacterium]